MGLGASTTRAQVSEGGGTTCGLGADLRPQLRPQAPERLETACCGDTAPAARLRFQGLYASYGRIVARSPIYRCTICTSPKLLRCTPETNGMLDVSYTSVVIVKNTWGCLRQKGERLCACEALNLERLRDVSGSVFPVMALL